MVQQRRRSRSWHRPTTSRAPRRCDGPCARPARGQLLAGPRSVSQTPLGRTSRAGRRRRRTGAGPSGGEGDDATGAHHRDEVAVAASPTYWVGTTTVRPLSRRVDRKCSQKRARRIGSTPAVGSSSRSARGRGRASAARHRRRCIPPERCGSSLLRSPSRSTKSSAWWRRRRRPAAPHPVERGGEAQVVPQRQVREQRPAAGACSRCGPARPVRQVHRSSPSTSTSPAVGPRMPRRMRISVVLPQPLGPMRPTIVPRGTSRSIPSSTTS